MDDDIKSDNPNVDDNKIVSLLEYKPSKTPKKSIIDDRKDNEYFVHLPVDENLVYKETGRRRKPYPWEDNFETSSDLSDEEKERLTVIYPKTEIKTRIVSEYIPYKYEAKNKGEITNKYKSDFSPEMAKNLPFNQSTTIKKFGNIIVSNTKFYAPFNSGITARKVWQQYFNLKLKGNLIESGQRATKPSYIKGDPNKSIKSTFGKQNGDYIKSKISPNEYTDYGLNKLKLIEAMDAYYGVRYALGGTSKKSIDCSAFTWRVFQSLGLSGSRTSVTPFGKTCQYQMGNIGKDCQPGGTLILKIKDLKFGDLVFFDTQLTHFPGHAAIYLMDGFIHHSGSPNQVRWMDTWYSSRFVAGKRYYKQDLQWMQSSVYKPSVKGSM